MATINANSVGQSTGTTTVTTRTTTVTTRTTGGGYVPFYAIDLTLNVYDGKTNQLLWAGEGVSQANAYNIFPQIDRIILDVIDGHLMSPAYMSGERQKYRNKGLQEFILGPAVYSDDAENEYLKPLTSPEKIGFYQVNYKFEAAGIGVLGTLSVERQLMNVVLALKNNNKDIFEFNPGLIKVLYKNKELPVYSKSDVTSLFFKAGENNKSSRDKAVKFTQSSYLEKHSIASGENYLGMLYLATPLGLKEGDTVRVDLLLQNEPISMDFIYQKGYMTYAQYKSKYSGK